MRVKARRTDLKFSSPRLILHPEDASRLGASGPGRATIAASRPVVVQFSLSSTMVEQGEALVPELLMRTLSIGDGDVIELLMPTRAPSVPLIRRTMDRRPLSGKQIACVLDDILMARISKTEVSAWLTALQINGLTPEEIYDMTLAMAATGERVKFKNGPVYDFHSVGGVPGNKITPIVVSIVAEAGLLIPKTSSRAISSACGTADFVEVFCDVEMDADRIASISQRTGGVFAWGGAMNLTPVNGIIIETQYPLGIDPRSIMMASIMSKKLAMGAEYLVMDVPMGPGTKVRTLDDAKVFAQGFIDLGQRLGMRVECAVTDGRQPLGTTIGPALEARECIRALEGNGALEDVREKAAGLAGMLLEMGGIEDGAAAAMRMLNDGSALRRFREIVAAQGGDADISSDDIVVGAHSIDVVAMRPGYVNAIGNKELVAIARAAGAPRDKGGGIVLHRKIDQRVERGDVLLTIHADHADKAERAYSMAAKLSPISVGGLLLERSPRAPPLTHRA